MPRKSKLMHRFLREFSCLRCGRHGVNACFLRKAGPFGAACIKKVKAKFDEVGDRYFDRVFWQNPDGGWSMAEERFVDSSVPVGLAMHKDIVKVLCLTNEEFHELRKKAPGPDLGGLFSLLDEYEGGLLIEDTS